MGASEGIAVGGSVGIIVGNKVGIEVGGLLVHNTAVPIAAVDTQYKQGA